MTKQRAKTKASFKEIELIQAPTDRWTYCDGSIGHGILFCNANGLWLPQYLQLHSLVYYKNNCARTHSIAKREISNVIVKSLNINLKNTWNIRGIRA